MDEIAALEQSLLDALAGAPIAALDAARELIDAQSQRVAAAQATVVERLAMHHRIHEALGRLRERADVHDIVTHAPAAVAEACDFDRVVLYGVKGAEMVAEGFFIAGDADGAERLMAFSREHPAQLAEQILETEMLRRRIPMAVQDALNHPRTYKPLVERYGTTSYVAAPIMPEGRVIGFLHADKGLRGALVDDLDADTLFAFAEGLGWVIERVELSERLRAQGRELRALLARADGVVAAYLEAEVQLVTGTHEGAAATSTAAALFARAGDSATAGALTPREHEVLALLAKGATNAQIATRLVITEETAKSHVKRILRKLGAGNRVEAAAMFLNAGR